jgi:hypothetical protein
MYQYRHKHILIQRYRICHHTRISFYLYKEMNFAMRACHALELLNSDSSRSNGRKKLLKGHG